MLPGFSRPEPGPRRWPITIPGGDVRIVEAIGFRVEHGALVLVQTVGNAMAMAPGHWLEVGPAADQQAPSRDEGGRR